MTVRRVLRTAGEIAAVPLGLAIALGLTDALRSLPGPSLALALPLRETGHDDRAPIAVALLASAVVFGLLAALADGRHRSAAPGILRSAGVLGWALTLQAVSLQLVRQASMGFDWTAAVRSPSPYVFALGTALGSASVVALASSDRWMRRRRQERPVEGAAAAPPLAKIGP